LRFEAILFINMLHGCRMLLLLMSASCSPELFNHVIQYSGSSSMLQPMPQPAGVLDNW